MLSNVAGKEGDNIVLDARILALCERADLVDRADNSIGIELTIRTNQGLMPPFCV